MAIQITTGHCTFATYGSCYMEYKLYDPSDYNAPHMMTGAESTVDDYFKTNNIIGRATGSQSASKYYGVRGNWRDIVVDGVKPGSLVEASMGIKTATTTLYQRYSICLMYRPSAALIKAKFDIMSAPESTRNYVYVTGRFDIIGPHLFKLFKIKREHKAEYHKTMTIGYIDTEILEPEISPLRINRSKSKDSEDADESIVNFKSPRRQIRMRM